MRFFIKNKENKFLKTIIDNLLIISINYLNYFINGIKRRVGNDIIEVALLRILNNKNRNILSRYINPSKWSLIEPRGFIKKTRIKEYIHSRGLRVSSSFLNRKIDPLIKSILDKAIERAKENGRTILRPFDL